MTETEIKADIEAAAKELLKAAQKDAQSLAKSIAADALPIAKLPADRRKDVLRAYANTLVLLGEIHRIKASKAAWAKFLSILTKVVARAAIAAI